MRKKKIGATAIKSFALLVALGMAHLAVSQQAMPQDAATPYPKTDVPSVPISPRQ
jgi:hypothetical protein